MTKPKSINADADADCFHFRNDDGGEVGARNRAHAADHHHDEGITNRDQIGGEVGGFARHLQRATEAGERRAEREHAREQHRLVDAKRTHHFPVLRRRTYQPPEAGARKRKMQHQQDQRTDHDQEQVIAGQLAAEHLDRVRADPARAGQASPPGPIAKAQHH